MGARIAKLNPWIISVMTTVFVVLVVGALEIFGALYNEVSIPLMDGICILSEYPNKADDDIIFLPIFDSSLKGVKETYHHGWPWPRALVGKVVSYFGQVDAASFVVDMEYMERSVYTECGEEEQKLQEEYGIDFRIDDQKMGTAIDEAQNVVLGTSINPVENPLRTLDEYIPTDVSPEIAESRFAAFLQKFYELSLDVEFIDTDVSFYPTSGFNLPIWQLLKETDHLGVVTGDRDSDGIARFYLTLVEYYDPTHPKSAFEHTENITRPIETEEDLTSALANVTTTQKRKDAYYLPSMALVTLLLNKAEPQSDGRYKVIVRGRTLEVPLKDGSTLTIPLYSKQGEFRLKYHGFHETYEDVNVFRILYTADPENGQLLDLYYNYYVPAKQAVGEQPVLYEDIFKKENTLPSILFDPVMLNDPKNGPVARQAYREEVVKHDPEAQKQVDQLKGTQFTMETIRAELVESRAHDIAATLSEEEINSEAQNVFEGSVEALNALSRGEKIKLIWQPLKDWINGGLSDDEVAYFLEKKIWNHITQERFQQLSEAEQKEWITKAYATWYYYRPNSYEYHYPTFPELGGRKVGVREIAADPTYFKDKHIVYIGYASSLMDIRATPFYENDPGGHLHATAIDNLLNADFIYLYNNEAIILLTLLILTFLLAVFGVRSKLWLFSGATLLFIIGLWGLSFLLYNQASILISPFYPMLGCAFTLILIGVFNYLKERSQKGFIKGAFGQYLSPQVIEQIMDDPDRLKLGGQSREMTAFFSDMAKFSTISEKLSPEELVSLLNDYLSAMCDIILQQNGTIDKFEGDAIIAFWGAPIEEPKHAILACKSTIIMQRVLAEKRDGYVQRYNLPLPPRMRIGLNSGKMVVGNMGTSNRMDYTMMGDNVNLAARLEGANKFYGTESMISESTYKLAKNEVETRMLDKIRVVGKSVPVKVYELIDFKGDLSADHKKLIESYNEGLQFYQDQQFEKAISFFQKALTLDENDGPSKTYIERCNEFIKSPPPSDWDGVYTLTSKG
jgi:class 3 adenylate cyclase/CHASE2 domain-containing sensor protein